MWLHFLIAGFLAAGSQAFHSAPIRWGGLPSERYVLAPATGAFGSLVGRHPQRLTIIDLSGQHSPDNVPHFATKFGEAITWEVGGGDSWCVTAGGKRSGDAVYINPCTSGPTQKWNWLPWGQIQLKDTNQCCDVADTTDGDLIELRECAHKSTQSWAYEDQLPLPTHQFSQLPTSLRALRQVSLSGGIMIAVAMSSLIAWFWRRRNNSLVEFVGHQCMPASADPGGVCLTGMYRGDLPLAISSDFEPAEMAPPVSFSRTAARTAVYMSEAKPPETEGPAATAIRKYFAAWNERNMAAAVAQFAENCEYDDTQYAGAFSGKEALEAHLNRVADALPPTFRFCVDEIADGGSTCGVQWHVENDGEPLPFTRGCSLYKTDDRGLIISGFDVPEPAPIKPGSFGLGVLNIASKLIEEPVRAVPLATWALYCTVLFFSNGILPGPDATQLDAATWVEVRDLSLNFWLIAPTLNLPFSPTVHPGLEGIFNTLLAWAAAFGGFLVDGRRGRPSGSMVPTVLGMQLLTNAFYLPYLATRSKESGDVVYADEFDEPAALVSESRALPSLLAAVGTLSIGWGFAGRPEFGDLSTRFASLSTLLADDRLGSSFVVDLVLFACFQGWLVDDDMRRRGVEPSEMGALRAVAKYVPFYGLCSYLLLRPPLPQRETSNEGALPSSVAEKP